MENLKDHKHNGTDSPKLVIQECFENVPQEAIDQITGTADSTYSSNEQTLINDLKTTVNDLLTKLANIGIIN